MCFLGVKSGNFTLLRNDTWIVGKKDRFLAVKVQTHSPLFLKIVVQSNLGSYLYVKIL